MADKEGGREVGEGVGKYFWTFWEIINQSITINPGIILKTFRGTGSTGAVGVGVLFAGLLLPSVGICHILASPWCARRTSGR